MAALASLGLDASVTIGVVVAVVGVLVSDSGRPDFVILSGLAVLLVAGVISPQQAFAGFSNSAVLTVGALYIVAGGVQHTDALSRLDRVLFLFSRGGGMGGLLARFMVPTSFLSGLLNNTPIVAMLTPRLQAWAGQAGHSRVEAHDPALLRGDHRRYDDARGNVHQPDGDGAGGYRFRDYERVGWPVTLLVMTISVAIISVLWL